MNRTDFDKKITVGTISYTTNDYGEQKEHYTPEYFLYANVKSIKNETKTENEAEIVYKQYRVTVKRSTKSILTHNGNYIIHNSEIYNIYSIDDTDRDIIVYYMQRKI